MSHISFNAKSITTQKGVKPKEGALYFILKPGNAKYLEPEVQHILKVVKATLPHVFECSYLPDFSGVKFLSPLNVEVKQLLRRLAQDGVFITVGTNLEVQESLAKGSDVFYNVEYTYRNDDVEDFHLDTHSYLGSEKAVIRKLDQIKLKQLESLTVEECDMFLGKSRLFKINIEDGVATVNVDKQFIKPSDISARYNTNFTTLMMVPIESFSIKGYKFYRQKLIFNAFFTTLNKHYKVTYKNIKSLTDIINEIQAKLDKQTLIPVTQLLDFYRQDKIAHEIPLIEFSFTKVNNMPAVTFSRPLLDNIIQEAGSRVQYLVDYDDNVFSYKLF